jgi:hypothetical protein
VTSVKSLRCDGCGAPLPAPSGQATIVCSYCFRELIVSGQGGAGGTRVRADRAARSTNDVLLRGYPGIPIGTGVRLRGGERPDWADPSKTVWPVGARASSTYGSGWSEQALIGPPCVFPRHGDISGAWAPRTRDSHVEWIEVDFPPHAPPAQAIRVFETNLPGATFAISILRGVGDQRVEEVIWQREPTLTGDDAQILEVEVRQPQHIDRLRVYVSNNLGSGWSEIDTVGLVTVLPVPTELRQAPPAGSSSGASGWGCAIAAFVAVGLAGAGFSMLLDTGSSPPGGAATPRVSSGSEAPTPPRAAAAVAGASLSTWSVDGAGLAAARTLWASAVGSYSSQYSDTRNAASSVGGPPDVFPSYGDMPGGWAPLEQDRGEEHIEVRFPTPTSARSIVILETFHPGALARVEDISDGQAPTILWEGNALTTTEQARVLSLDLPSPRVIGALRIVLDTTRRAGWNEIDAVGLLPAP